MEPTRADWHSGQGWQLPSSLFQARYEQLSQAVAAGCLVWVGFAQHGPHVDESQRLCCSLPCEQWRLCTACPGSRGWTLSKQAARHVQG